MPFASFRWCSCSCRGSARRCTDPSAGSASGPSRFEPSDTGGCRRAPDHRQPPGAQRNRHGQAVARRPGEIGPCRGCARALDSATTGPEVRDCSPADGVLHALRVAALRPFLCRRPGGVPPDRRHGRAGHLEVRAIRGCTRRLIPERRDGLLEPVPQRAGRLSEAELVPAPRLPARAHPFVRGPGQGRPDGHRLEPAPVADLGRQRRPRPARDGPRARRRGSATCRGRSRTTISSSRSSPRKKVFWEALRFSACLV